MKAILNGYSEVNFKTDRGDHIEGLNLYVSYEDNNVIGEKCERFFVNKDIAIPNLKVGDSLNLFFNHRGKVESITTTK
jgi:hypothetical protein